MTPGLNLSSADCAEANNEGKAASSDCNKWHAASRESGGPEMLSSNSAADSETVAIRLVSMQCVCYRIMPVADADSRKKLTTGGTGDSQRTQGHTFCVPLCPTVVKHFSFPHYQLRNRCQLHV